MNWFGKNPGINSAEDRHLKQVAEEITRDIADGTLTQEQGQKLYQNTLLADTNSRPAMLDAGQQNMHLPKAEQVKKINQLIQESGGGSYFLNTGNKLLGRDSFNYPLPIEGISATHNHKPNFNDYKKQALYGAGQDVLIDINSLNIDVHQLKQNPDVQAAYENLLKTSLPQKVKIQQHVFNTPNYDYEQFPTLGKIKLRTEGIIQRNSKNLPIFSGTLEQGDKAEVFTFPPGNRGDIPEVVTWFGRQAPITQFRTIFKGKKSFQIEF